MELNMNKITLRKALRLKNNLVGEMKKMKEIISNKNSLKETTPRREDIVACMDAINVIRGKLIELKSKIAIANTAIYAKIYEVEELKSHIAYLNSVSTTEGYVTDYGESEKVKVNAAFNSADIGQMVKTFESRIEFLNDEIDEYNGKTYIEVSF
jgi:uncharacterized protein YfbU (UPF0304 family)